MFFLKVFIFCLFEIFSFNSQAYQTVQLSTSNHRETTADPTAVKLNDILKSIHAHRKEIEEKLQLLSEAKTEQEKEKIQSGIDTIQQSIEAQENSFEMILTAGIELSDDETSASNEFDWQKDLIEILQPFLRELHKLTENKRKLDHLNYRITFHQLQIQKINEALKHITIINTDHLSKAALQNFEHIRQKWHDQLKESTHLFEVAQLQRNEMIEFKTSQENSLMDFFEEFSAGRGATLFLALMAFGGVYFIMMLFMRFCSWILNRRWKTRSYYQRVVTVVYHLLMGIVAIAAFFYVLEVRDDAVLTGITVLLLITVVWVLKNSISTFIDELRLLLNTGSAREGECIIYNGIPMQIESLHYYTKLSNPFLPDLKLRLTLSELTKYVSRPVLPDEPWFPCRKGDYVMMYGDIYGKVKHITLENIVLSLPDGTMPITYNIEDFFYANPRNFSYGFNVTTEFSMDTQQLEISRTEIPSIMSEAIREGLEKEIYGHSLKDVSVHLVKIESSFLEYQIIANFDGVAAGELYAIQRDIQRYAIDISERKKWLGS
ncbi:hypothetical protein ABF87_12010 [Nitrosomonas sp. JL21]|nr:hypothetical protein [Nitrosomonas sp. JL21]